jgi:hypothetical protein
MSEFPRIVPAGTTEDEPVSVREESPNSLIARLRERTARQQEGRTLDVDVPGFGGELLLRFKPLDLTTLDHIFGNQSPKSSGINETIEALTRSCVGVLARDGDELVQLSDAEGPVLLEDRLAVLLDMPHPAGPLTGREVVLALFGGNAFALGAFVDRVVTWMGDPDAVQTPGEA